MMTTNQLIDVALKAGEILLRSGAEVYRVEDTIFRIFKSYDVDCECFVLLTAIFITAKPKGSDNVSVIRRIKGVSYNLHRIELVNSFSRNLQERPISYQEAMEILEDIENATQYNFISRLVVAGLTALVFTLLFNGNILEAFIAFGISLILYAFKEKYSVIGFLPFFEYFVSGVIAAAVCLLALSFNPSLNIYIIIIGSIMMLLPGMALTSGIKDALHGDTVSSLYRLTEAMFISVALGAGVGVTLSIGLRLV